MLNDDGIMTINSSRTWNVFLSESVPFSPSTWKQRWEIPYLLTNEQENLPSVDNSIALAIVKGRDGLLVMEIV